MIFSKVGGGGGSHKTYNLPYLDNQRTQSTIFQLRSTTWRAEGTLHRGHFTYREFANRLFASSQVHVGRAKTEYWEDGGFSKNRVVLNTRRYESDTSENARFNSIVRNAIKKKMKNKYFESEVKAKVENENETELMELCCNDSTCVHDE